MLNQYRVGLLSLLAACYMVGPAEWVGAQEANRDARPTTAVPRKAFKLDPLQGLDAAQLRHPLVPEISTAFDTLTRIENEIQDYTCTLVRRERIRGRLQDYEYLFAKVRHRKLRDDEIVVPFSMYLRYQGPARYKGREVLYVEDRDNGDLLARNGGSGNLKNVTMWIDPNGERARRNSHWPPTDFGIKRLTQRLIEAGRAALDMDLQRRECEVRHVDGAKINGRTAKCIQIKFPVRRENLEFHVGRIFTDDQSQLPVRFAYYTWPLQQGEQPRLMGEYNYLNLKLNVGLTDRDFDRNNPEYDFYLPSDDESPSSERTAE